MKPIAEKFKTYIENAPDLKYADVDEVRKSAPYKVHTYSELIQKLAKLAYYNPEHVLLYRGQSKDYPEDGRTTLYPSMYRSMGTSYNDELKRRYQVLEGVERRLWELLQGSEHWDRVGRNQGARWAVLQHYEVCDTPFLDVTSSLQVACSFACGGSDHSADFASLYVLGLPQISGAITVANAQALQVIRLNGVCPPDTLRPYLQDGYLLGTYPSVDNIDQKMRYDRAEMDCSQRLIAKFHIATGASFWDSSFSSLPTQFLYPNESNGTAQILRDLKEETKRANV